MLENLARLQERWDRVYHRMEDEGWDALAVCGTSAVGEFGYLAYLTGFVPVTGHAYAIFRPGQRPTLFIPSEADLESTNGFSDVGDVHVTGEADALAKGPIIGMLVDAIGQQSVRKLGIVGLARIVPAGHYQAIVAALPDTMIEDGTDLVAGLKAQKQPYEIDKVKEAAALVEDVLEEGAKCVDEGVPARDVIAHVEAELRRRGALRSLVFVNSGPHYARLATDAVLRRERLITILVEAASPAGYWAEIGGGFSVGAPPETDRAIAEACEEALRQLRAAIKPAVAVAEAHRIYRQVGEDAGLRFGRGLGHGVGVDHDAPALRRDSRGLFEEGNVLSVHPHYVSVAAHAGCALVDMLLVESSGATSLFRKSRSLCVLPPGAS